MIVEIRAWQHIYANVEKSQSPHQEEGFQTLFYSSDGLSRNDVDDIESRLTYFSAETNPVAYRCFSIPSGKLVVSKITPITELDRFGRSGRYLAHSFVFAAQAFAQLKTNGVDLIHSLSFVDNIAAALNLGDFKTGNIQSCSIRPPAVHADTPKDALEWSTKELITLNLLALQAEKFTAKRTVVVFIGSPEQVLDGLQAALLGVPSALASFCTFDTHYYRQQLSRSDFWAVGLSDSPEFPNCIVVNLAARQIIRLSSPLQGQSAYECWVTARLEQRNPDIIAQYKEHAYTVCRWLEDQSYEVSDEIPTPLIKSIFQMNVPRVRDLVKQSLEKAIPGSLAKRVFETIYQSMDDVARFERLREGFSLPEVTEFLFNAFQSDRFRAPPPAEIKEIGELLTKCEHPQLRLFYLCWLRQTQLLRQELGTLDDKAYQQFVRNSLNADLINPDELLISGRGQAFLEIYLQRNAKGSGISFIVNALLREKEIQPLSSLKTYIVSQSPKDLTAILSMMATHPEIPGDFQEAVTNALFAYYQNDQFRAPPPLEVREIGVILKQVNHTRFKLIHLAWTGQLQNLVQDVSVLDTKTYGWFVNVALTASLVTWEILVIPGYGEEFLKVYLPKYMKAEQPLRLLAEFLLRAREIQCLNQLIPYIPRQSKRELEALDQFARIHPEAPEDFRKAISNAIEKLNSKSVIEDAQQPSEETPLQGFLSGLGKLLSSLFSDSTSEESNRDQDNERGDDRGRKCKNPRDYPDH